MSDVSPERIRDRAAGDMSLIFWFHMRIMMLLFSLRLVTPSDSYTGFLALMFAAFCNACCLAERFWDIQFRTLIYWHPLCQLCFLSSRLLLVTISVIVGAIWVRIGWDLVFMGASTLVV
jgi:hypothetical protein